MEPHFRNLFDWSREYTILVRNLKHLISEPHQLRVARCVLHIDRLEFPVRCVELGLNVCEYFHEAIGGNANLFANAMRSLAEIA